MAEDERVETVGPGAEFRHDYDYLADYRDRSDRALERLLEFRRRASDMAPDELRGAVDAHLDALR
ncbi:MAG: hypothetical protein ABEN55_14870, partial [Bradymonadaceae bacterium]